MDPSKAELRLVLRARRAAEPQELAAARARSLAEAAGTLGPLAGRAIAAFLPTNSEPDITALVTQLALPVFVPRVVGEELEWVRTRPEELAGSRTGIPVPVGPAVARGAGVVDLGVGLMLVPALAVDPESGTRLGYGRGFYDRLLGSMSPDVRRAVHVVAVCRGAELVRLSRLPHDEPVDGVITEAGYRAIPRSTPAHDRARPRRV